MSLSLPALAAAAPQPWQAVVSPDNSLSLAVLSAEKPVFQISLVGWGPKWQWIGLGSKEKAIGPRLAVEVPFVVDKPQEEVIQLKYQAWKAGPKQIVLRYDLSAAKDVPITMIIASLGLAVDSHQATLRMVDADGKETVRQAPLGRGAGPTTAKAVLSVPGTGDVVIAMEPPCPIGFDSDMRIMLAADTFKRGERSVTLTLDLPGEVEFIARQEDMDRYAKPMAGPDWFAFQPTDDTGPTVISMNEWLDRPAGKHGGVRMTGDRFQFDDGTPVKFWGTNLSYGGSCAPEKKVAAFTAARFAKYGVNGARLHKFTYPKNHMGIGDLDDATKMDPQGLDRLDYFASQLKKQGVYFGWSHTYGFYACPANAGRLAAYAEIARNLKGNTYAFINFAEDVQDLLIETVVHLLKHKNPYTGLTYAEEPALSFIELQNEDDIFFYTSEKAFNACPTYRKLFIQRFCDWLTTKYVQQDALKKAWGEALKPGETLAARNIVPQTNPWFFGDGHLPGAKGGYRQRLLDNARFLHDVQNQFYAKFVKAIREAGYKGPLNGSPWQAPSMLPHYYNLRSDYLVGYIDRHNYFGGKLNDSMLKKPGSGYFSSGLQQVIDRPFGLSEWIHVYPSLYSVEGPAILAAYGMGLQGWDCSYQFQSQPNKRMFDAEVGRFPWGVWEADVPTQIGQYPALARMIHRGDVQESEVISVRRMSLQELESGKFSFADQVSQQGDVKTFGGTVPAESLAAGRVVVEFTDKPQPSTFPAMDRYRRGDWITSSTKQLAWNTAERGFFLINTPGTKGVVGFAAGKPHELGDVTIGLTSDYALVLLTALDKTATLANARSALVCALARNANSGFKYFAVDNRVLDNGKGPIMLEPVKATITLSGRKIAGVHVLDHDGRRNGKQLTVAGGQIAIDTGRDQAIYYEVVFE